MYSGTTFRTKSGRLMGAHQKIDRVAYRHSKALIPSDVSFPSLHNILHFEGLNGPDGIKRKSPARDEPWHYVDPSNKNDVLLLTMIEDHIINMSEALKNGNEHRAAFEAAWMAHAIVDGLTPAHHYPLEAKLEEIRGEGLETRITTKDKLLLPGASRRIQMRNNWEFWGAKGVMTTHLNFELGVATTIATRRFEKLEIDQAKIQLLENDGFEAVFNAALQKVVGLKLYDEFNRLGWTRRLAHDTLTILLPEIIQAVTLGWYAAVKKAVK